METREPLGVLTVRGSNQDGCGLAQGSDNGGDQQ